MGEKITTPVECLCGCGEHFVPKRKNQKYRTPAHKDRRWNLEHARQKLSVGASFTMEFQKHRYRVQIMEEIIA